MAHRGEIAVEAPWLYRAMHVSREKIVPLQGAPVYIGQTLVEVPATVIAPAVNMDRFTFWRHSRAKAWPSAHVETVVKPWLTANTRWALNNHRLCWARMRMSQQQTSSIFCRLSRTC